MKYSSCVLILVGNVLIIISSRLKSGQDESMGYVVLKVHSYNNGIYLALTYIGDVCKKNM